MMCCSIYHIYIDRSPMPDASRPQSASVSRQAVKCQVVVAPAPATPAQYEYWTRSSARTRA
jgi:hypothetical protein